MPDCKGPRAGMKREEPMNVFKSDRVLVGMMILAAALAGMGLVYYATSAGPGVGGDATIYLTAARNFITGKGLGWVEADGSYRLLPYSPPFYPLVLSAVGLVMPDLVAGARWLNMLLFGITIALFGWTFYRFTARPGWLGCWPACWRLRRSC